jgi:hypothetical protein
MAYRYEESLSFHPLVSVLYIFVMVVFGLSVFQGHGGPIWVPAAIGLLLVLLPLMFGRLVIAVDEESVTAVFGFLGWPSQRVPLSEIVRARAIDYRPILTFGGWGIRFGRLEGERTGVYSIRGTRGTLLELNTPRRVCSIQTTRFLLGSQEPERLVAAIGKE